MYDQYQGLIFDMGGTLLNTEPTHRKAWFKALFPYEMHLDETSMACLRGAPTWYLAKTIIEGCQAQLDPYQLAREKTAALYNTFFNDATTLPLVDVVKRYYGKRPMAVGTGSEHSVAEALLRHLDLFQYFDALVGADDIVHHKPDPQTFLRCAELMGVPPESCVVFEDTDFGIMAAKAAKMEFVDVRARNRQ